MAAKQKKSKALIAKNKQLIARRNRTRATVGNFNMSDAEADFYYEALRSKQTPLEFFNESIDSLRDVLKSFDIIGEVFNEPSVMDAAKSLDPETLNGINEAHSYIEDVRSQIDVLVTENTPILADADEVMSIGALPIIDTINDISNNIQENAAKLLSVIHEIYKLYAKINTLTSESDLDNPTETMTESDDE